MGTHSSEAGQEANFAPIMLDTNVLLYYLIENTSETKESVELVDTCHELGVPLAYAPSSLKDVFYKVPRMLRQRQLDEEGPDSPTVSYRPAAWACVRQITDIAVAAPQGEAESHMAYSLRGSHNDYEDNLVIASAETCRARYVATFDRRMQASYPTLCAPPATITAALRSLAPLRR